ncbi:hypothetical protein ES711_11480 [Gelidibacter salicanalis]|uniref:Nucleotide-binding protein n=1 Tax=Gelidibacter salicanalis TaxID=291193 RepID=A0A5C7AG05_9FLAO|nr:hypothetical protein [Gelidibacter salicanalis]TXE07381.1 hypothetical protein ES711_11480 [Gelidibacter salicanalis]
MKTCPNCKSDVDAHFELCWNCNYSFIEQRVMTTEELTKTTLTRDIQCLRCETPMEDSGRFKFHEGDRIGFYGSIFELFQNREAFDVYHCKNCGKVEFFLPID